MTDNNKIPGDWGRDEQGKPGKSVPANPFAKKSNPDTDSFPPQGSVGGAGVAGKQPPQYRKAAPAAATSATSPVQVSVPQPSGGGKGGVITLSISAVIAILALIGAGVYALTGMDSGEDLTAEGTTTIIVPATSGATSKAPTGGNGSSNRSNNSGGSGSSNSGSSGSGSSRSNSGSTRTTTRSTTRTTTRTTARNTTSNTPRNTSTPTSEPEEAYVPTTTTPSCDGRGVLVLTTVSPSSSTLEADITSATSGTSGAQVFAPGSCASLNSEYGSSSYIVAVDYGSDTDSLCSASGGSPRTLSSSSSATNPCDEPEEESEDDEA